MRIIMWRALAGKVGKEYLRSHSRACRFGKGKESGRVIGSRCLDPPVDARGRRQMHAHLVPHIGKAVAKGVYRTFRVRAKSPRRHKNHARRAERQQRIAFIYDTDADSARSIITAASSHRHPRHAPLRRDLVPQHARNGIALEQRRHVISRKTGGSKHDLAPVPRRHIQPQCSGAIGQVRRHVAGHAKAHIILGQQNFIDAFEVLGFMLRHPQQFRCCEPRHGKVACDGARFRNPLLKLAACV